MKWLERLEEGLAAFLLAALTLVTFAQVVARDGFGYSFSWAPELTAILFSWLIFLGLPYGVRVGSHIGVDALGRMMGPVGARITGGATALLCVAYSLILLVGSWHISRPVMVFGFGLLALRFSQVSWRIARGGMDRR